MRSPARQGFIPALRFHALTRFYDRVLGATLKEERFKRRLIEQAAIAPGHHVLDLGCGTGTLTILLQQACPAATVVGLDADAEALRIAGVKAAKAGVNVELCEGSATAPRFRSASFDRIVSSLVFHHLSTADKRLALRAALGLLRPGGELHVADWGRAQNLPMRVAFLAVQVLDGFATTGDNVRGRLPLLMREAGFESVEETHREATIFGTLSLYRASRAPT